MKTYCVIGLGRFGAAVARKLYELGNEVLVVDGNQELIQQIANDVTHAVVADARDEQVLKTIGVQNYDCCIVAIGDDLASSILITLVLKGLNVPRVICKANDEVHKKALEKIGADRVVIPEREMAAKLALNLSSSNVLDFIELSKDYGIVELSIPENWVGKTIREADVRAKYGVNVLALKQADKLQVSPAADCTFEKGSIAVVLGTTEQIARMQKYEARDHNK